MADRIKITKTSNTFGKTSKETVEVSGAKLARQLDLLTDRLGYNAKTIEELTKDIEKQRKIAAKNGAEIFSTKEYMDQIRLEQATLGLSRARLMHAEFLQNYEKRIKELNKQAYKDNILYKGYSAVKNEQNSPFTAATTNLGIGIATAGMINPVIAQALHLDKLVTAPITALTHKLLGMGHTTSSAIQNELDAERNKKIEEISENVKELNSKTKKSNVEKESSGGGILGMVGSLASAAIGYLASNYILKTLGAPDWLQKIVPPAVAGFALGGVAGAVIGGIFGLVQDDLFALIGEYIPKLKNALDVLIEKIENFMDESPIVQDIKDKIQQLKDEYGEKVKEQIKDFAKDAAIFAAGTGAAMWGTKKFITKVIPWAAKETWGLTKSALGIGTSEAAAATGSFEAGSNMIKVASDNLAAANDNAITTTENMVVKNAAKGVVPKTSFASKVGSAASSAIVLTTLEKSIEGLIDTNERSKDPRNIGKKESQIAEDQIVDYFYDDARAWNDENLPGYLKPFLIGGMAIDAAKSLSPFAWMFGAKQAESSIESESAKNFVNEQAISAIINSNLENGMIDITGENNLVNNKDLSKKDIGFMEQQTEMLGQKFAALIHDPQSIGVQQLKIQQSINEVLENILHVQEEEYQSNHNYRNYIKNQVGGKTDTTGGRKILQGYSLVDSPIKPIQK